ncbi:MAG: hypothetical protein PHP23_10820 [Desulfobacterales bacterium]|nr:hypothetical protein [Desulfobacterales bacterium]MDD4073625.1 hypothetical protein [Desulfobacterales bacterium]
MRVFLGFDDTDTIDADRGTGKLARWFGYELPEEIRLWAVVRLQLLVHDDVPYTSHNSSACVAMDVPPSYPLNSIIERAVCHLQAHYLEGSDPGICLACDGDPGMPDLMNFGVACTLRVVTQKDALRATSGASIHLSGHGGTNDGIIGAAAAVGLTASGWAGRFIEFGKLRDFPDTVAVSDLEDKHIRIVSLEKNANGPAPSDQVITHGWLRPRLLGNQAVLMVKCIGEGVWEVVSGKKPKQKVSEQ